MRVMTYVVQVRARNGVPIMLANPAYPKAGSQPALWGANPDHGPSVFTDVEAGLTFCVNMQREFPDLTYHLIPANEVEVQVPEPRRQTADRPLTRHDVREHAAAALAFGRDR